MVLYHTVGVTHNKPMTFINTREKDFDLLVSQIRQTYQSEELAFNKKEDKDAYKRNQATYFIAGDIKPPYIRNNEAIISRSLLVLDIDDLALDDESFIKNIAQQNNKSPMRVIAYPTISHQYHIEKSRYRVVFELDRSVNADEYYTLIKGVTDSITRKWCKIYDYKEDSSNITFSQLQGCYIKTVNNAQAPLYVNIDGQALKVDELLKLYKNARKLTNKKRDTPLISNGLNEEQTVDKILRSKQGGKFKRLFLGDISDYQSPSEARCSLINMLIFWTGGDVDTIESIMWQSDMNKDKWDTKRRGKPFITWEIERAIQNYQGDIYEPYEIYIQEGK